MDDLLIITTPSFIFITILIIIATTTILYLYNNTPSNKLDVGPNLPPGPRKLPIIGNLPHMIIGGLPHHRLRDLARQYGPIMHLQLGEISTIVITSAELAKQFMQTHDLNFATRPSIPSANIIFYDGRGMAFGAYSEYWKQMRKIFIQELVRPSRPRLHSLRLIMEEEVGELMRSINQQHQYYCTVNLSRMLISLVSAITYRMTFGKKYWQQSEDHHGASLSPVLQEIMVALGGFSLCDVFPSSKLLRLISRGQARLKKLHKEADVILEAIINDHKATRLSEKGSPEDEDFVDVLLNFSEDHGLGFPISTTDIKAVIMDIFLAGSETSSASATINWAMSELLKNPKAMEKAQTEVRQQAFDGKRTIIDEASVEKLEYLKLVVKETLRLHHPPLLGPREARESMVIYGYRIPAKSRIIINSWALGRDPCYWGKSAEEFYPERFLDSSIDYNGSNFQLIPFGAGRRICPGMHFAVTVVKLTLANLLNCFDWKLPDGKKPHDLDITEEFSLASKKKTDLFVIPVPYRPN